jgi:hypothetical protein
MNGARIPPFLLAAWLHHLVLRMTQFIVGVVCGVAVATWIGDRLGNEPGIWRDVTFVMCPFVAGIAAMMPLEFLARWIPARCRRCKQKAALVAGWGAVATYSCNHCGWSTTYRIYVSRG